LNGGYDPRDPCKQKCVTPLGGRKNATSADTLQSELTVDTTSVIYRGEKVAVNCNELKAEDTIICTRQDDGKRIDFNADPNAIQKSFYKPNSPPDGEEWIYVCNFLEQILYNNCWTSKSSAINIIAGMVSLSSLIFYMTE
jgi:hypothetical protein